MQEAIITLYFETWSRHVDVQVALRAIGEIKMGVNSTCITADLKESILATTYEYDFYIILKKEAIWGYALNNDKSY